MKASLQKRTNTANNHTVTAKSQHVSAKRVLVVHSRKTGRFAGMSENLEKLKPVRNNGKLMCDSIDTRDHYFERHEIFNTQPADVGRLVEI